MQFWILKKPYLVMVNKKKCQTLLSAEGGDIEKKWKKMKNWKYYLVPESGSNWGKWKWLFFVYFFIILVYYSKYTKNISKSVAKSFENLKNIWSDPDDS